MVCFIYMLEVGRWTLQTVNSLLPLNFVFSVSFQRLTFGMSSFLPETAMHFQNWLLIIAVRREGFSVSIRGREGGVKITVQCTLWP